MMEDIPQDFRGYQPRNYGANYHGKVSLSQSLSESYNIPFVKLLSEIGLDPFLHFMHTLGIQHFKARRSQLGLSVAVGLEVTPLELSQAYVVLANQGVPIQMTLFPEESPASTVLNQSMLTQIQSPSLSKAASWLVGQSLRKRDRPDFPSRLEYTGQAHPLAWKTGTSFGFHDAWTVGWGEDYVSTIWFGNLHYGSSVHLIGSQAAGTVFFELMERLEEPFVPPSKPEDLIEIRVCSQTGMIPNSACTETRRTEARQDRVPTQVCSEHQHIWVTETGERGNPSCSNSSLTQQSVWVPSIEYQRWSNLPVVLPPIEPSCQNTVTLHSKLSIHNPKPDHRILLLPDGQNHNIQLIANHNDPNAELYWFVDSDFIGHSTTGDEMWWTPTPGTHTILVTDNSGQRDSISVIVDTFQNVHVK
jgi:penicillin-binding protein 1C